ncbi:Clr5 domain-containing protein [Madurella fahalii]|uniref:Clr5 domain-containing protein n=1 Tax=Madurella fahalii TaxID=1157608 RepID=A0ABQ0GTH3_9PEZI
MPPTSDTRLDWGAYREKIEDLYWRQRKLLPEVMKTMEDDHGFVATKKMYKKHLKSWGLEKNIKAVEMIAMLHIAEQRRRINKETRFIRRGRPVEPEKLRRFAKRYKLPVGGGLRPSDQQVATPPDITYTTPEPDPLNSSLPPPVTQPSVDPEPREAEEAAVENPPGPHGFESCESPSTRNVPWTSSVSMCWPAEDTCTGSQSPPPPPPPPPPQPAVPVMDELFISQAFSRPEMPSLSHSLPRSTIGPPFSPSPWPVNSQDIGYHGYQARTDGIPPWIFVSQASHHAVQPIDYGLDHANPPFSNEYNPGMAMFRIPIALGATSPPRTINPVLDVSRSSLDHTQLHDTSMGGNLDLATALLEQGANANCVARGGMTPLHYAASRGDVGFVRLLMSYGANLNAVTDKGQSVLLFAVGGTDMVPYANQNRGGSDSHTDDATIRVINALYDSPVGWARLRQALAQADKDGVTPLMLAAKNGFTNTVIMFLQRGALPDVRDHAGHTALKYAASGNHRHLVRLLLEADPRVQAHDVSHLLKLANRNLAGCPTTNALHGKDSWWDVPNHSSSALVAEEMVRLCREMGTLDGLLRLTEEKRKTGVLELLMAAMGQLDMAERASQGANGS